MTTGRGGKSTDLNASEHLACLPCRDEAMLEEILRFDNSFLARVAGMTDEDVLIRFRHCPTAFHCIVGQADDGSPRVRGYFIILPLTFACAAAIRRGEITSGKQIRPSDLALPDQPAEAVYLSVACAAGPRPRAALISAGTDVVRTLYWNRGIRFLFARAATVAGARMLTRLTQERFDPDGVIHEIDVARYYSVRS